MTHAPAEHTTQDERRPVLEVGAYRVDVRARRIIGADRGEGSGEGSETRVEPKVMRVLQCLAERPGEVVSKEEFMDEVWGDTVVTDDALLRCISALRKAFGDDARSPEYIETIRSQGYRLIAPVRERPAPSPTETTPEETAPAAAAPAETDASSRSTSLPVPDAPAPSSEAWKGWALALAVVALVAAGVLSWSARSPASPTEPAPPTEPADPLRAEPLTSLRGEEVDPALSPDGERVVFARRAPSGSSFDLYLKKPGRETPRRLTNDAADDRRPAFSPDGRRVAFVREDGAETSIAIVPVGGGPPRRVKTLQTRDVQKLAWAPDGRALAFSAHEAPYESFSLFLFSLETLNVQKLTAPPADARGDFAPAFSPDGNTLAFLRSPVSHIADVYTLPVNEGNAGDARRLTRDNADITGLDWMPEGEAVVFSSDRAGSYGLWNVGADGGTPRWMATTQGGALHQPAVARTRRALAYVRRLDETHVWKRALADTTAEAPAAGAAPAVASTRRDTDPALSPDGRRLAFVSDRSGSDQLWTADTSGARPTRLTDFDGHVTTSPRWSPEGRRIAFDTRQEGSADIYVVGAGGGTPRRLTPAGSNEKVPRWSRDGQRLYFASNRSGHWQVWKIPAGGAGPPTQVTTEGGFVAQEGPSGTHLYYSKRSVPGLWRRPLDGDGREERVVDDLQPRDGTAWTIRDGALYYVRRGGTSPTLMRRSLDGGASRMVASLDRAASHASIALSPDARWVFYAREDRRESDLMFVASF
jgi:Tol biopolymer transport system component/DNA-binding winged helix-turn-helix (wHTH) protein